MRPTWAEIDLEAISANVQTLSKVAAPARLCAVVKADGYGHGDVPVADAALSAGADYLAVALVEEGVRLRDAGIVAPILLLSEPPLSDAPELFAHDLIPTIYTQRFLDAVADATTHVRRVHVKVDTGMHRVGADPESALDLATQIASSDNLSLEGVWTHFPVADTDPEFTFSQIGRFGEFVAALQEQGIRPDIIHAANTPGTLLHPQSHFDMVRTGLGIYGLRPKPEDAPDVELRPAMRVVSHVALVRSYPAGTRFSYGLQRSLPDDAWVATVPVGYADGIWRPYAEVGGEVLISGRRRPLAGSVTMDQIMVDCGRERVPEGSEVVLLGTQGDEEITADEWASRLGTINYEVVCRIGPRMPRRYLR
ncbi:MAG: alanine racemase [Acidimicrobiia bacterium]